MAVPEDNGSYGFPIVRSVDAGDVTLLYRVWEAASPRAHLRIVHGLGEHAGRYTRLAELLLARGISTYAADLRGHGVSGGRRGHVDRFAQYLSDFRHVREATPDDTPAFVLGHSLGGLIALRLIQTDSATGLRGAILSAPAVDLPEPQPWWREPATRVLSPLMPTISAPNGIDPADLSRDPVEVEAYRTDPLVHDRITIRLYREMRRAMQEARKQAAAVTVPLLLLTPGTDRVTDVGAARLLADQFAGPTEVRDYPQAYHEPFHDPESARVMEDLAGWLDRRIG